ncbi:MAG: hypothetical protein GF329_16025 [Candidatus Lokiarchaeota archaeon]|nr:hypothetical protein [Candidatus Lokiarchaeota archaeon]
MMEYFPISGPLRMPLLILELMIIYITFEVSVYFFIKYRRNLRRSMKSSTNFDWAMIFVCFGLTFIFYVIANFYATNRDLFLFYGYLSLNIGSLIFSVHLEYLKVIKTKFIFTIVFSSFLVLYLTTFFIDFSLTKAVAISIFVPVSVIFIVYFYTIFSKIRHKYRNKGIGLIIGIILVILGYAATSDISLDLFGGIYIRLIGDILMLVAIFMIAIFANSIPSFSSELDWHKKLKYIFVINSSGICLYSENFQEKSEINELLLSGAVMSIQTFIREIMTEYSNLKVISKGSDVFIIEKGDEITCVLIAEQELEILKNLLYKFVISFEDFFGDILKGWSGELDLFSPTIKLIDEIFTAK